MRQKLMGDNRRGTQYQRISGEEWKGEKRSHHTEYLVEGRKDTASRNEMRRMRLDDDCLLAGMLNNFVPSRTICFICLCSIHRSGYDLH